MEVDIETESNILSLKRRKENINRLVNTVENNKLFNKLIIYSLNSLKSYLTVKSEIMAVENALLMLNSIIILTHSYL